MYDLTNPYMVDQMAYGRYSQQINPNYNTMQPQYGQKPQLQPQPTQVSNPPFVSGLEGAKAYAIPNGNSMVLMDSENSRFYIKSVDGIGMPTIKGFDFVEVDLNKPIAQMQSVPSVDTTQFVARSEFDELKKKIDQYESMFEMLISPKEVMSNG